MKLLFTLMLFILISGCITSLHNHPRNLLCSIVKENLKHCADSKNSLQFDSYEDSYLKTLLLKKAECKSLKAVEKERCQKELINYIKEKGHTFNNRKNCHNIRNVIRLKYGSLCDYLIGKQ